jgi:hypothetical protein
MAHDLKPAGRDGKKNVKRRRRINPSSSPDAPADRDSTPLHGQTKSQDITFIVRGMPIGLQVQKTIRP